MGKMIRIQLYRGPHDGESIEFLEENLKIMPVVSMTDSSGNVSSYEYTDEGKFMWLSDPESHVPRGFVVDDDGNIIAEVSSPSEASEKLDDLNDESEQWKYDT